MSELIEQTFLVDPAMIEGSFDRMSVEEKINHHASILLGSRDSVGGFVVKASQSRMDQHCSDHPEDFARLQRIALEGLIAQGYLAGHDMEHRSAA